MIAGSLAEWSRKDFHTNKGKSNKSGSEFALEEFASLGFSEFTYKFVGEDEIDGIKAESSKVVGGTGTLAIQTNRLDRGAHFQIRSVDFF